jgi:CelD/BcsL family acetyltransferase involved in cellulose biosynthesis
VIDTPTGSAMARMRPPRPASHPRPVPPVLRAAGRARGTAERCTGDRAIFTIDPLTDPRWPALVDTHPQASAFHTTGWLRALQRTYGYTPLVLTTAEPDARLADGLAVCHIRSWVTGSRLVSLPFSDHCDPLVAGDREIDGVIGELSAAAARLGCRRVEIRPTGTQPVPLPFTPTTRLLWHVVNLAGGPAAIFAAFHPSSIQRKIRRAEREGITYDEGNDEQRLGEFYRLLVMTRRRHGLPPQPLAWFQHLVREMGDGLTVRLARRRGGEAIAAMITLRHRTTAIYKYGASDQRFHPSGAVPMLFWRAMQAAAAAGCTTMDLGRTDRPQGGLIRFKERLGATATPLTYWHQSAGGAASGWSAGRLAKRARPIVAAAPDPIRIALGRFLYRHIG